MNLTAPVMSQFANELDCLRARDRWFQDRIAELEKDKLRLDKLEESGLAHFLWIARPSLKGFRLHQAKDGNFSTAREALDETLGL